MMVLHATGQREVIPGARWRDEVTGSAWEVVEHSGGRIYSPCGFGGTPIFWCRCVDLTPAAARYQQYAREDGCVEFCGDSIAGALAEAAACAQGGA